MLHLRQSTASQSVLIGPFVDSTDGNTVESGLTIANTDIRLSANGGNIVAKNSGGGTHDEIGYYTITLDATDTATVGRLQLMVHPGGALPVYHEYQVLEENVFDAIYAASAGLGTDVAAILVDTGTTLDTKINNIQGTTFNTATDSLEAIRDRGDSAWTGGATTSDAGTAQAGAATTITLRAGASAIDNIYQGQLIFISAGTGVGESKAIASYVGSTKVATIIGSWPVTPNATSVYEIYPADIDEIIAAPTSSANAIAVWDLNTTGHTIAGTFGEQLKNDVDAILSDTDVIGGPVGASISADIAAIKAETAAIFADTDNMQPKLGNPAGASMSADIASIKVDSAAIFLDTDNMQPKLGVPAGASMSADIAAVKVDTANIGTAGVGLTNLGGMSTTMKAQVKTEALAVMNVDTYAEPGQGSPGATITLAAKVNYLYKGFRNRKTSDTGEIQIYDAAGAVVDHVRTHSDNGTLYDQGTLTTGP